MNNRETPETARSSHGDRRLMGFGVRFRENEKAPASRGL
jgi:hypothetical protein